MYFDTISALKGVNIHITYIPIKTYIEVYIYKG